MPAPMPVADVLGTTVAPAAPALICAQPVWQMTVRIPAMTERNRINQATQNGYIKNESHTVCCTRHGQRREQEVARREPLARLLISCQNR